VLRWQLAPVMRMFIVSFLLLLYNNFCYFSEDKPTLSKIVEAVNANYKDRYDEVRLFIF
jgi:hypothetical protein